MNTLLSNHDFLISQEAQELVANFYEFVATNKLIVDKVLLASMDYSCDYFDKNKLLPSADLLQSETGFTPAEFRFSNEQEVLYKVRTLEREMQITHFRKQLMKVAGNPSHDEMLEQLSMLHGASLLSADEVDPVCFSDLVNSVVNKDPVLAQEGARTGIEKLDAIISPILMATMVSVCAGPSQGKTMVADNFTYVNAVMDDKKILYLSLEVPKEIVAAKMLSRHSYSLDEERAIPSEDIRRARLREEQKCFLKEVAKDLEPKMDKIRIFDSSDNLPFTTATHFDDFLEAQYRNWPFDILILDYLQILKSFSNVSGYESYDFMNTIVARLRRKCQSIGDGGKFCVLLLSQTNRAGYDKALRDNGKRGYESLSAIAEVNEIGRSSQVVIFLLLSDIIRAGNEIKYQLLKNRDGTLLESPFVTFFDPKYSVVGETISKYEYNDDPFGLRDGDYSFDDVISDQSETPPW